MEILTKSKNNITVTLEGGSTSNISIATPKPISIDVGTMPTSGQPIDLTQYAFSRIMQDNGQRAVSLSKSQGISLVDYIKSMTKKGLYTCYVQSGTIGNPPAAEAISSSLRGIFYLDLTTHENGYAYAWILLFDKNGNTHTLYLNGASGGTWKSSSDKIEKSYVDNLFNSIVNANEVSY